MLPYDPAMVSSEVLTVERAGAVATVWLDRAEKRNAMGRAFWSDLPVVMEELSGDDAVRAVVLAARGPAFSVGLDLKEMGATVAGGGSDRSPAEHASRFLADVKRLQASITSVERCRQPVIAAVHGWCLGGAIDLITACDIRLAAADAVFSVRETKIAIVADVGTLQRLPRVIPRGHVAELAYTGKDIDAERARAIGLVNDVLPDHDAVVAAATSMAQEIAANSPLAVQGTKAVLQACADMTVEQGLDYVGVWNAAFLRSHDLTEAMTAFLEKREPRFEGR